MGLIITLILVGLVLIFAEVLLIPGVGIAGVLGLLSMGGSCYYAFAELGNTTGVIVTAVNALLIVALTIWILRAKTWKRLTLNTNIDAKAVVPEVVVEVGQQGRTVTRLAPMGAARFGNNVLEVTSYQGMIDSGTDVKVVAVDGMKVYVDAVEVE
jgi:membrane-bound ClpP family serine protease